MNGVNGHASCLCEAGSRYPQCAAGLNCMSEHELTGAVLEAFLAQFIELYADLKGATIGQVGLTRKMMQTIKLGVHSGMHFEEGIFAIIHSLMCLDGMVLRCKPEAVLLRDMQRFIAEFERFVQLKECPARLLE